MTTRTSHRWRQRPGSFDAQNSADLFATDNRWGIPKLQHTPLTAIPKWLAPYGTQIRSKDGVGDGAVHFFLDDYRFERVWNRPNKALVSLEKFATLLTPDFSLYHDWPLSLQLWNTYRSRWCGAFWQQQGFTTIPTISWSDEESYAFCFCGIPTQSVVAVSTVGVRLGDPLEYALFVRGFQALVKRLQPVLVLCYGKLPALCHQWAEVVCYPTRWMGIRHARSLTQRQLPSCDTTQCKIAARLS